MLPFLIKYFKLALQTAVALNTAASAEKSIIISF